MPGPAVPGSGDVDRVEVACADHAVHVGVDEVEPRRRAPVAEQARLDVLRRAAAPAAAGCRAGRSDRPKGSWRRASRRRSGTAPRPPAQNRIPDSLVGSSDARPACVTSVGLTGRSESRSRQSSSSSQPPGGAPSEICQPPSTRVPGGIRRTRGGAGGGGSPWGPRRGSRGNGGRGWRVSLSGVTPEPPSSSTPTSTGSACLDRRQPA